MEHLQVAGAFSQPLVWDTSKVTNMKSAFQAAGSFNGELNWDTSSVTLLERTLYQAFAFNRPLVWDVSKVTTMPNMLRETSFNQPASLAAWDVSKASAMTDILTGSALASDECSKVELRDAWQSVAAFTYDWSAAVCPGLPSPPPPSPPPPSPPPPTPANPLGIPSGAYAHFRQGGWVLGQKSCGDWLYGEYACSGTATDIIDTGYSTGGTPSSARTRARPTPQAAQWRAAASTTRLCHSISAPSTKDPANTTCRTS